MTFQYQAVFWSLANKLIQDHQFEFVQIDKKLQEIWLEKEQGRRKHIVRLSISQFTWGNHLKQDILKVAARVQNSNRGWFAKPVVVHNLYLSEQEPADEWERLKKPMIVKGRKPINMQMYYLDADHHQVQLEKFFRAFGAQADPEIQIESEPDAIDTLIEAEQQQFLQHANAQRQAVQQMMTQKKPKIVYGLLAVNIIFFMLELILGGSTNSEVLIQLGAKYNPLIIGEHEWWRIVTSMFLHIGVLHLLMNMISLFYLGTITEQIYGSWRFLTIYFLSGIIGGLASFSFSATLSAGASGAIFGMFGALLFFGLLYRRIFWQTIGSGLVVILIINLFITFSSSTIDAYAHIGGLIGGFTAAAAVGMPAKSKTSYAIAGWIGCLLLIVFLLGYGLTNPDNQTLMKVTAAEEAIAQDNYEDVITITSEALEEDPGDFRSMLLFNRGLAYYRMNEIEKGVADYQMVVSIDETNAAAAYNLALGLENLGELESALEQAEKAHSLEPDNNLYTEKYQELSSEN